MAAKSAAVRKAEQRERDKLTESERLARLLSRTIRIDLYKSTDAKLIEMMAVLEIEEAADLITRLIHGSHHLDREQLESLTKLA